MYQLSKSTSSIKRSVGQLFYNGHDLACTSSTALSSDTTKSKADKETTEKNQKRMNELYDQMQQALEMQRMHVLQLMESLSEKQQERLLKFTEYFSNKMLNKAKKATKPTTHHPK